MPIEHPDAPERRQQHDDEEDDDAYLVSCRCESVKALYTLLLCLKNQHSSSDNISNGNNKNNNRKQGKKLLQPVTVFCTPTNLTFHVYRNQMQSSVDLQSTFFADYDCSGSSDSTNNSTSVNGSGGEFCINLTTVLDCLLILGTNQLERTKCSFNYNTTTEIFKLELLAEHRAVLCTAAIPGMLPPELPSLTHAFQSTGMTARLIVRSDSLLDVLAELECVPGATQVRVGLSQSAGLVMETTGHFGSVQVHMPAKGGHVISAEFHAAIIDNAGAVVADGHNYSLANVHESLKGLEVAEETCITVNAAGMMAIQHQVLDRTVSDVPSFVDFIFCSLQEDDDDDEEDESRTQRTPMTQHNATSSVFSGTGNSGSQARIVSHQKDAFDNDDDSEAKETSTLFSVPPDERLFGSVVATTATSSVSKMRTFTSPPRRRRRIARMAKASPNLLDTTDEDEDDDDDEELDVTAMASPPRDKRSHGHDSGDCSSPELVYGQQH
jgi:Repair protein Rad1/Rec1/Rad17